MTGISVALVATSHSRSHSADPPPKPAAMASASKREAVVRRQVSRRAGRIFSFPSVELPVPTFSAMRRRPISGCGLEVEDCHTPPLLRRCPYAWSTDSSSSPGQVQAMVGEHHATVSTTFAADPPESQAAARVHRGELLQVADPGLDERDSARP